MSSKFAMNRLSRSPSSIMVVRRSSFACWSNRVINSAQGSRRTKDCGEGRLEIMRDRGQQRRAQTVRFGCSFCPIQVFDETDALNGERRLMDQCIEQSSLIWRQKRPLLVAVDADNSNGATASPHRQEKTLCAGSVSEPCPAGLSFSQAHFAAARSAASSVSSGG